MKRLLCLLGNGMTTSVYEGPMTVIWGDGTEPSQDHSPIYYDKRGVGYDFSRTSKLKPNLPTVVVQIPFELLGMYETTRFDDKTISIAAAD